MWQLLFIALLFGFVDGQGFKFPDLTDLFGKLTCDEDCESTVSAAFPDMEPLLKQRDPYPLPFPVLPPLSNCKLTGISKVSLAGKACVGKVGMFTGQTMDIALSQAGVGCDILVLNGLKLEKGKLAMKWKGARLKVSLKIKDDFFASDKATISCDKPPCRLDAKDLEVTCPGPAFIQKTCDTMKNILKDLMLKALEMAWPVIVAAEVNKNRALASKIVCEIDDK